ncbi:MAG TPA: MoaD/ThiS family protein [Rhizomicrobium sp.]|nr:MoaD/ThiS family protein [Rhizomicrobium sp.]
MASASPVRILIASPLHSYTGADEVEAFGATLGELLADLDARFPGIRFRMIDEQERIRKHIRFFINGEPVHDLGQEIHPSDEVCVVQALSGG